MNPLLALFESFTWWVRLTSAQQFFYGIGIAAGLVTLVLAVLSVFGLGDHDVRGRGDVVAARRGDVTHRNNDGLGLL